MRPAFAEAARELGAALAGRGIGLVYGGGNVGLMGVIADATLGAGGEVTGVITSGLMKREVGHTGLKDLRVVSSMHERKALIESISDAFIALPGGYGTFDELFEIITWAQLSIHQKPVGLLNTDGFYNELLRFLDTARDDGFIKPENRERLLVASTVDEMLKRIGA